MIAAGVGTDRTGIDLGKTAAGTAAADCLMQTGQFF